jgi:predicted transcriptional regulator
MPATHKLTKLEMQVMEALWARGPLCIRDIQESFPVKKRPIYATIQTIVYRLETKKVLRRTRKIGNAHIFEAVMSRGQAHGRWIDELLGLCGGRTQPLMTHLVESGKLTLDDLRRTEELLLSAPALTSSPRNCRRSDTIPSTRSTVTTCSLLFETNSSPMMPASFTSGTACTASITRS